MKQCIIKGKGNINKICIDKDYIREDVKKWNIDDKYFTLKEQKNMLNNDYLEKDKKIKKIILDELNKKLKSYKNQDLKKDRFDEFNFIIKEKLIELLKYSELKCYYCNLELYILYKNIREDNQWTLDRIDNDLGHNNDNVVISCLQCNLKRRKQNDESFLFTKKLLIKKQEY